MMLFFETGLTALLAGTGVPVGFGTGLGGAVQEQWSTAHRIARGEHATPRHARTAPAVVLCGVASCRAGTPATAILWAGLFGWLWGGRAGRQPRRGRRASGQKEKGTMEAAAALHATAAACAWRGGPRPASCPDALRPSFARSQRRGIGGEMKTAHASGAFRRHARLTCFGPIAACRPLTPPAARRVRRFWTCGGRQQGWPPRPGELIPTGYHAGAASQRRRWSTGIGAWQPDGNKRDARTTWAVAAVVAGGRAETNEPSHHTRFVTQPRTKLR
jgi:hypothetical protein